MVKKRVILFVFLSLVLIHIASASLIISPNPYNINVTVNQNTPFQLNLINTYNFEISDFTFSNLTGFNFPSITLSPNQNKTINFNVTRDSSYSGNIQSKIRFNYVADIPTTPTTYYVNITSSGFSPSSSLIRKGDTIIWTNKDTITHSVTSSRFDFTIPVNLTASYTFNNIETLNYQDLIMLYSGVVTIINSSTTAKVNNPAYDVIWSVNINAVLNPTTLEITNLGDTNASISSNSNYTGVLKIKNIGTELAQSIHLSSNLSNFLILFQSNDFSLASGTYQYVQYNVLPALLSTNETNKTYTPSIIAKSSNSNEVSFPISIFIPYSDITASANAGQSLYDLFINVFCKQHPEYCQNSTGNTTQIIYRDPDLPINMTVLERYNLMRDVQAIKDSVSRTDNSLKSSVDEQSSRMSEINKTNTITSNKLSDLETSFQTYKNISIIVLFLLIIGFFIYFMLKKLKETQNLKYISSGGFKT